MSYEYKVGQSGYGSLWYIQVIRILDGVYCLERREGVEVSIGTGYPDTKE